MALSKKVQRSLDPNNKAWAQDTSRFGYRFLQKYGWEDGKGLGANLDGMTSHIKVVQKQDTKGVGSSDNADPWLKNTTSYDNALARLAHLGKQQTPKPEEPSQSSSIFVKSAETYSTSDAPAPSRYIPPNVRKHKLNRYSEEEMRGIFATPSATSTPAAAPATLPRYLNEDIHDEIDQYTVTSSMNMLDYFASSKQPKKTEPEAPANIPNGNAMDVSPAVVNHKKRQREEATVVATIEAPPDAKKSKMDEEERIAHSDDSSEEVKKSKKDKSKKSKKDKKDKKEKKKRKEKREKKRSDTDSDDE